MNTLYNENNLIKFNSHDHNNAKSKEEAESLLEGNKKQLNSANKEMTKYGLLLLVLVVLLLVAYVLLIVLSVGMPVYWFNHENLSAMAVLKQSLSNNTGMWIYALLNIIITRNILSKVYDNYKGIEAKRNNIQSRIQNLEKQIENFNK